MKLLTTIAPRKDGTVTATGAAGEPIVFRLSDLGLVGEVEKPETIGLLLATGNFEPLEESDFDAAEKFMADWQRANHSDAMRLRQPFQAVRKLAEIPQPMARQDDDDDGDDDDAGDDTAEDDFGAGAGLIESNTPPKPGKPPAKAARQAARPAR
jgi:hypothetical protein